jgi:hypothetical protein
MRYTLLAVSAAMLLTASACAPKIYGTLQLIDQSSQPIAPSKESPEGTVVNMINTAGALDQASHAVSVMTAEGAFESEKGKIVKGIYKVEASRIGYQTETRTVEVGRFSGAKIDIKLKKIPEGKYKSIMGSRSDEDKIVNPGEVNIQPPVM